jgi:ABC-type phosphate/phosphonate transport system permease subunit
MARRSFDTLRGVDILIWALIWINVASVRFGILPKLMPVLLSQVLYAFEPTPRSASIIGIVGAGGIGLILSNKFAPWNFNKCLLSFC